MTVVERLVNLRDLGGLPVVGGGVTRAGILYRSDAPYPDDERPDHVPVWPPAAVLDLRSQAERDVIGHEWTDETVLHHRPLHDAAAPTVERAPHLAGLYANILDAVPDRIAGVLAVAAHVDGPLLIHCAAGKDRTGIAVAALLLAADVDPGAVVADYLATADNMSELRMRWQRNGKVALPGRPAIPEAWLLAPEDAIRHVVDRFAAWPAGASGWLVDHGASPSDLEAWRTRFVG